VKAWTKRPNGPDTKGDFLTVKDDNALLQSKLANQDKANAGNKRLIRQDYQLLDKFLPDRVRSIKDWMEKVRYL
jgi:hypothetical protein